MLPTNYPLYQQLRQDVHFCTSRCVSISTFVLANLVRERSEAAEGTLAATHPTVVATNNPFVEDIALQSQSVHSRRPPTLGSHLL